MLAQKKSSKQEKIILKSQNSRNIKKPNILKTQ